MNSVKSSSRTNKRPAKNRPFVTPARRVQKFSLGLPFSKRLIISLRRFRTNKGRRSKLKHQLVIPISFLRIREIAFELKASKQQKPKKSVPKSFIRLPIKTAAAYLLILIGIAAGIFFGTHLQKPAEFTIESEQAKVVAVSPQTAKEVLTKSLPLRLQVPKIGIDTQLSQVGLQADGQMEMPWDIETAAWYKYSPTPGELGPSVIVGHLDGANYANMTGVFYRLHELSPGDKIMITRTDGTVAVFKILYLKQVPQNDFPTQEIYGNINYAGIRLITCGGTFDSSTGHYNQNTVVYGALDKK